ncbi:histidine kinase dimerization/phosphoacceptor domain-containing protein [Streptomyces niveus]|uniref:histidine kinase dimerization/phosphoacceptor domain-containing protein n=1 Tax=Streptomyces niveus TaxID=193462 RepID=UPI00342A89D4
MPSRPPRSSYASGVVIALLATATACMGGLLSRERREHAVALRSQEVAEAVIAERLRITRELHDMVAHSIGIIAIQAGAASHAIRTRPTADAGMRVDVRRSGEGRALPADVDLSAFRIVQDAPVEARWPPVLYVSYSPTTSHWCGPACA